MEGTNSENEELMIQKVVTNEPEEQFCIPNGFSIVDMQHIFAEFQKIGDHAKNREDCGIRHLKITGMKRSGLRTILSCAVAGTIVNGGSYAQMEEFLAAMNIPSMSKKEFRKHHDKIVKALIVAAEEEMVTAAEEEKRLAIERGDIVSGCGIPHIPVVADGSWMKRSYRTGTKMKEVVKMTTPGPFRRIVESSIRRMRADIVKAAEYRYSQQVTTAEKIKNLYADIHNVPSHVFGEHADCSKLQYFCDGTSKKDEKDIVPELMKMGVYEQIKEILRPLLAHAESLLYNSNNNAVESFNGIVAKYTGGKRLNFGERGSYTGRCAAAVLQYNTKQVLSRLNTAMNKEPPVILRKIENRRKKENEKYSEKRKEKKITKHVRKQFRSEKDSNYGPNAEKPDMANNIYELEKKKHMEMLQNWQNRRDAIEEETIGQAKNPRWLNYKSKLLTASNFGRICRRRIGTLCGNSVKSLVYPRLISAPAVQYGQECEKFAREQLSVCIGVEIKECGLFIDSAIPFLGASPDGLIDEEGIVEIKCPKTAENLLPEEAIKTVAAIRRIFADAEGNELNRNHYYYYQVQGQLHVTDFRRKDSREEVFWSEASVGL
uniref:uncharacterized protein LOC117611204 n=1 Tax=Osmia lignaria TaxID=473952 RepID=UPI00147875BA|nr:uncharacterized protein LOC117611204 [Osmia lignaria]